jgi:hypothetical protein
VPREQSYAVLLISASEYRIDGAFRYGGGALPEAGAVITVVDDLARTEREARVRRVTPEESFAIHAIDVTPLARSVGWRHASDRGATRKRKHSASSMLGAGG